MATISNQTLKVVNLNDTTVTVTVTYTLTPTPIEKLARTVFSESIRLIGNDDGTATDIAIHNFKEDGIANVYAVDGSTNDVIRVRTKNLPKSALNEDPGFVNSGAEQNDEVLARITVKYAANAPTSATLPPAVFTPQVAGAWK
jgi:hypothetical protein